MPKEDFVKCAKKHQIDTDKVRRKEQNLEDI